MDLPSHLNILRDAIGTPGLISRPAFRMIALGNLATDIEQATPGRHFDNAPDRETLIQRWNEGVVQPIEQIVRWCAPRGDGRLRNRSKALWWYGKLTHTLQDFYAHTNWVELQLATGWTAAVAPLLTTHLAAEHLPATLQSGYFGLRYFTPRHRFSGCPVVAGELCPPLGYQFCHAQLAKDSPRQVHGSEPAQPGGPSYYDLAAKLASDTTRASLDAIHYRLIDAYGSTPHNDGDSLYRQLMGFSSRQVE